MGTPGADRVRHHFESQQADGLAQIRLWVPRERAAEVRELAARLVREHKQKRTADKAAELAKKREAFEARNPWTERTRGQVLAAMVDAEGTTEDEIVRRWGDAGVTQWAARHRWRIVG